MAEAENFFVYLFLLLKMFDYIHIISVVLPNFHILCEVVHYVLAVEEHLGVFF